MKADLHINLVVIFKELFIFHMLVPYVHASNGTLIDISVLQYLI